MGLEQARADQWSKPEPHSVTLTKIQDGRTPTDAIFFRHNVDENIVNRSQSKFKEIVFRSIQLLGI